MLTDISTATAIVIVYYML